MTAVTLSREELLALADRMDDHSAAAKAASRNPPIDTTRSGWLQASQDFADSAAALRLAAKPADEGVRDAISKAYFIQRTYDKNSGAHIISFGFNLKEDALVLENLSTTEEPKR